MDAPDWLVRSELSYVNGAFFARLDANCTDERFYTYLNDASAESHALLSIGANGFDRLHTWRLNWSRLTA